MQNDSPSSYFNRLLSSTSQLSQRKQHRKNSQKQKSPFMKQREQSVHEFTTLAEQDVTPRNRDTPDYMMTKKKSSSQQPNQQPPGAKVKQLSAKQLEAMQERIQEDERRDYLVTKITPVLNKMLVKIVNEKPKKILDYMIDFLKKEEGQFQQKRFNTRAQNDTILQDKNMEEVFDETVAAKFLRFKK